MFLKAAGQKNMIESAIGYHILDMYHGYSIVENDAGYFKGLADKNGNLIIDFLYDELEFVKSEHHSNSKNENVYLAADYNDRKFLINKNGDCVIPMEEIFKYEYFTVIHDLYIFCYNASSVYFFDLFYHPLGTFRISDDDMLEGYLELGDNAMLLSFGNNRSEAARYIILKKDGTVIWEGDPVNFKDLPLYGYQKYVRYNDAKEEYEIEFLDGQAVLISDQGELSGTFRNDRDLEHATITRVAAYDFKGNAVRKISSIEKDREQVLCTVYADDNTGEVYLRLDEDLYISKTDHLIAIGQNVYNSNSKLIAIATGSRPVLLENRLLYKNSFGKYMLVDSDGMPVYENEYEFCTGLGDMYCLQNRNGDFMVISSSGEKVIDYGVITTDGEDLFFNGSLIMDDWTDSGNYSSFRTDDSLISIKISL